MAPAGHRLDRPTEAPDNDCACPARGISDLRRGLQKRTNFPKSPYFPGSATLIGNAVPWSGVVVDVGRDLRVSEDWSDQGRGRGRDACADVVEPGSRTTDARHRSISESLAEIKSAHSRRADCDTLDSALGTSSPVPAADRRRFPSMAGKFVAGVADGTTKC
jgi:hypothetical protein